MYLYDILIKPLELIFEVIYVFSYRLTHNHGVTIICLSLAVNFLALPLYKRADAMQAAERKKEKQLDHWREHIKKTFKGDTRFMMLQTYYRQNDYRPIQAVRGALPLLLEIPFFIAAYHFLSSLTLLQGTSFGILSDLGAPDGLINAGGVSVNVLPVLMTAINLISGTVYTKDLSKKDKLQLYGVALIFLVLLYKSPSGLVFYWTLNNIFSLAKNIVYSRKSPVTEAKNE